MRKRLTIILCVVVVCVLSVTLLSGDWEEISSSEAYYYPVEIFYDGNGTPEENTGDFSFRWDFNAAEYNAVKVRCDIMIEAGGIEFIALADKDEQIIKEWTSPSTSFEEKLDREVFRKIVYDIQQGSEGTEGKVIVTLYGRPKLITLIKREINYIIG